MKRVLRYIVEFPGECVVGYNSGLNERSARGYAIYTASRYGGILLTEFDDGKVELTNDYSRRARKSSE